MLCPSADQLEAQVQPTVQVPKNMLFDQLDPSINPEKQSSIKALPGTMASRSEPLRHIHRASRDAQCKHRTKKIPDSSMDAPFPGGRFTSVVKDLFRKDHIDETHFETIDDYHWSED